MAEFKDFNVDDLVRHANGGVGTVERVGDAILVRFDQETDQRRHWYGEYDRDWFRIHPNTLSRI